MSPVTILSVVLPSKLKALSGHHWTHFGSPSHVSHTKAFRVSRCSVIAPYSHASRHQPHPSHSSSSTVIVPFSVDCFNAFFGQAATHGASLQTLQVTAILDSESSLTALILDLTGLNVFSFSSEQTYSHMSQPVHFCGSQLTNWLTVFRA